MNTTLSWIKAYVPELDVTAQEYTDAMTLSGTKVEGFVEADRDLDKIVIGQIEKIERHPDADKLIICQVNIGNGTTQIVTGAPNVQVGDKIPVVLDGGRVAGNHDGKMTEGGIEIKKGKLRGVESNGMMCSIEELGSTKEMYPEAPEYGIYIFPEDAEVGSDAIEALGLHDVTFEYEVTSNRVDCFSVIGIAREAAATFRKEFHPPVVTKTGNEENAADYVKVTVKDPELCPRYCARIVKNIKIAPSPKWMQRRLAAAGIRPINNIVDITNYVMEEYGQPMHAYDYDTLAGHEIVVRRAGKDEKFTTLDGQERTMDENVVMICDGEKSVGIGGIMGGENSMITDDVKTMLFDRMMINIHNTGLIESILPALQNRARRSRYVQPLQHRPKGRGQFIGQLPVPPDSAGMIAYVAHMAVIGRNVFGTGRNDHDFLFQRMGHAELVIHVGISVRNLRQNQGGVPDRLLDVLYYGLIVIDVIRTEGLQARFPDRGRVYLPIYIIEQPAKRHNHKTNRIHTIASLPKFSPL